MPGSSTHAESFGLLAITHPSVLLSTFQTVLGTRDESLSQLHGWPARSPAQRFADTLTDARA